MYDKYLSRISDKSVLVAILPRSLDQLLPLKLYNCPKVSKPEQKLKETKADICHTPEISVTLVCHFFFHDYDFGLKGTPPEKKCFLLSIARKGGGRPLPDFFDPLFTMY